MASRLQGELPRKAQPGDILLVVHEFIARSPDELSLAKGDRIELIERDDDFGDGWFLGRHMQNGNTGLFPEVYTTTAPKTTPATNNKTKTPGLRSPFAPATSKFATTTEADDKTPAASDAKAAGYFAADTPGPATTSSASDSAAAVARPTDAAAAAAAAAAAPATDTTGSAVAGSRSPQQNSAVMNETLSVIDEHITNMNKPNRLDPSTSPMASTGERRPSLVSYDSGSQYSNNASQTRLAYVAGSETEEEDEGVLTEAEVSKWSPAKVAEYLESAGVEKAHCDIFREEEFTGEVILQMEQSQVFMKEFNLGPIGRRMRTWQKIKGLQDEVKMAKLGATGRQQQPGASQGRPRRGTSPGMASTPPLSGQASPRPSAASIRSIGHRRHSSTEQPVATGYRAPQQSDRPPRAKQSSFDRSWTMGAASLATPGASSAYSNGSQPVSSMHLHTVSADRGNVGKGSTGSSQVSLPTPTDTDKGYVSGGDFDSKRSRNILRKRDVSSEHNRAPSYNSEKRRSAGFFWQKHRSEDQAKPVETSDQSTVTHRDGVRIVSEPIKGNQTSPTVTRLEYDDEQTRGYRDSSSKFSSTENKRASTNSETTQTSGRRGLRTISDAITGREKSLITSMDRFLPGDNIVTQSPDRTSSTPSGTTPTLDNEDANRSEFSTPAQGFATSGTRRKSKKATSAYTRGLEKKSPQEQMNGCDHSGWMKKKSSNLMTTWKPRLFVLRGRRLSYYYSENDTEEKGLIDISNHRVLPADNDFITNIHASLTGVNAASPTSPQSGTDPNTPMTPYSDGPPSATTSTPSTTTSPVKTFMLGDTSAAGQTFLFKLVPPRSGLSKGVNFTRPSVHYFAVPNRKEGRDWMAALMKATIDRDENSKVITTYQQKTISLEQARARKERPPFLMGLGEEEEGQDTTAGTQEPSLGGDTAVTENSTDGSGIERIDQALVAPINADAERKDESGNGSSGLGIQGLSAGSTGRDSTEASGASRLKASGVWS